MASHIEDYALLSDMSTAALVSRDGSVDWFCTPRFDAEAAFAALLGTPDHGRWLLAPAASAFAPAAAQVAPGGAAGQDAPRAEVVERFYGENSFVLHTVWTTDTGSVRVTDFMPLNGRTEIVRRVEGLIGEVTMHQELQLRFSYGRTHPWMTRYDGAPDPATGLPDPAEAMLVAMAGPDALVFRGDPVPEEGDRCHAGQFQIAAGQIRDFTLTYFPSHRNPPAPLDVNDTLHRTVAHWSEWTQLWDASSAPAPVPTTTAPLATTTMPVLPADGAAYPGTEEAERDPRLQDYRDARLRSLLVIRALMNRETGGLIAAPTTSLPEVLGGQRNWDHRFCWLRDVAQAVDVAATHGHEREAAQLRNWLLRAIANDPSELHNVYGVAGESDELERTVDFLPGYESSRPVRRGNGAAEQLQGDAMGQLMVTFERLRGLGFAEDHLSWPLQQALLRAAVAHVGEEDQGIWEMHGGTHVYTHSQVMLWAALDAGVRAVRVHGLAGDDAAWAGARDRLAQQIWEHGYDAELNSFVQVYGGTEVDSSLLNIAQVGFVAFDDPRMLGTAERIEQELGTEAGLIYRYRNADGLDGIEGQDNPHLASSLWLAQQHIRSGRTERGRLILEAVLDRANDVGLLSTEYSLRRSRMTGNFPQSLAHIALVDAIDALLGA
ncbi:glycoside hydrolase family 15 protein [Rothia kristinae]|uniref:glycoside hydrolase family 15 protein n=1 Tax=Rothia kristinae TaxID=37923 RepID=UPI00073728C4|nr:glycoside hydrolase family 15 protein [Rothia kristinae]SIM68645.1 glycosyl hydrolase, glucoamylase [Mycobacteroides abscessus subsp. abscessus]KTR40275.1 glucoamylase [Rothia kristinae]KTR67144.1 glucoamylase [Rothia kristinae]KTR69385.1 glucoamylase [Rothia kristinae]KTR77579.1 glucoamylase [Rothia kristinae]